jgi:hypothetical protein
LKLLDGLGAPESFQKVWVKKHAAAELPLRLPGFHFAEAMVCVGPLLFSKGTQSAIDVVQIANHAEIAGISLLRL